MSNQVLKDAGLSEVSDSSSSSGSRGGKADEPHPIAMVTATRVIDLDPEFGEPTTRIVDDTTERASNLPRSLKSSTTAQTKSARDVSWPLVWRSIVERSY
ncbi:hypothetical protein ACOSQ2_007999 [Xanthoceras sorbifolium]